MNQLRLSQIEVHKLTDKERVLLLQRFLNPEKGSLAIEIFYFVVCDRKIP
jgi:hypothetical protein